MNLFLSKGEKGWDAARASCWFLYVRPQKACLVIWGCSGYGNARLAFLSVFIFHLCGLLRYSGLCTLWLTCNFICFCLFDYFVILFHECRHFYPKDVILQTLIRYSDTHFAYKFSLTALNKNKVRAL